MALGFQTLVIKTWKGELVWWNMVYINLGGVRWDGKKSGSVEKKEGKRTLMMLIVIENYFIIYDLHGVQKDDLGLGEKYRHSDHCLTSARVKARRTGTKLESKASATLCLSVLCTVFLPNRLLPTAHYPVDNLPCIMSNNAQETRSLSNELTTLSFAHPCQRRW